LPPPGVMRHGSSLDDARAALGEEAWAASLALVRRVVRRVDARLELAALFGSRARGDARPDSDTDVLLLFRALPPDREPQATQAETLAEQVAAETGIPVSVWSVSLEDLREGRRTPMLVDALADAMPLWPRGAEVPRVAFTPRDALFCARCLLERVEEGSREVARAREAGQTLRASRRARDDLVRLCTAALMLDGQTRPRRAEAVRALRTLMPELAEDPSLAWAERSYQGAARDAPAPSWAELSRAMERLRCRVEGAGLALLGGARSVRAADRLPRMAP
jgi:predicted nucleotidyltransferase